MPNEPTRSSRFPQSAWDSRLSALFGLVLLVRLLYPFFNSPLTHLFSDPLRHWNNGARFLAPDLIGAGDPYVYQLWLYLVRTLSADAPAWVQLSCGVLCAAMPYGWYRALRELLPRNQALVGALLIAMVPSFLGIYAYFMNETLLLTLTGFAFWLTLHTWRTGSLAAWTLCCTVWTLAVFTRVVALPMAAACLPLLWLLQRQRLERMLIGTVIVGILAVVAGLHAKAVLGYFEPLGNGYITEIYNLSGKHDITLNGGAEGSYNFGSPSFYNPTFYPFSDWATDRRGVVAIRIDVRQGRDTWIAALTQATAGSPMSRGARLRENLWFLLFGQSWPDNDRTTLVGWASVWCRWLWPALMLYVAAGTVLRRYRGHEWLLPLCALGMLVFFALQSTAIMEGRYRKPVDPILLAAAIVLYCRTRLAPAGAAYSRP
ncbi:MAG: glycosyltransferase family 39 protein [Steroidobacteraceae bacterium]